MPRRADREDREAAAIAFGEAVRRIREGRKETLEDVARRIPRLDPRYLGEIELGFHVPSIVTAQKIAGALELPLAEVVKDL